ncbi:hypothetical protein HNQ65_005348 [Prosthecobacter vanneervenii]|uniref:Uncharacterized protein n=2 Tax=Prosthecobacter vanneervenii TaxID=48466 RepID=A0A7W8DMR1_9BACT|nr:hypothetical protein [Prosthecobacter vanneervenii]
MTYSFADTSTPMFGDSTLSIQGDTYTWSSATEDSTWHYDTYTDNANANSQTVTVKGLLGASWAMVSGPGTATTISGHIQNGVYGENHQTFSGDGSWVVSAVTYTHREMLVDYSMQDNGLGDLYLGSVGYDNYTGANGTLNNWWYANGDSHSTFTGGTTPFSQQPSLTVFGTTYQFNDSTSYSDNTSDGSDSGWTDNYHGPNGRTLQLVHHNTYFLQVWDPFLGTVGSNAVTAMPNASLTGITWRARSAPTFAKPQLWLDEKLLNWQSGSITTAGLLTDTYSGAGITLTIQAQVSDYFAAGSTTTAIVTFTSGATGSGTLAQNQVFSLSGHTLRNAEPNHSSPWFTGTNTILKVAGVNFAFKGGFQDSLGNRTDVFASPQTGTLSISGTTATSSVGTVKLVQNGTIRSGTYSNGQFTVTGNLLIYPLGTQPSVYGPPAFWVRGELYLRNATTPTNYATASSGHSLTLTGTDAWILAGTDATGDFGGTCSTDPVGIFLVQDALGATTVPVIPANADGTVFLDWSAPPSGMPPAVIENNHILVYLGTATEDTSNTASAAYYGSATVSDQTPWLLKLRTDGSGVATFTDYSTGTSTTGSYSTQTHLFQTANAASDFPMPVYGVDPNANNAVWSQILPPSTTGLPATFLVNGKVWRYSGTDSGANAVSGGNAVYQGYYSSSVGTQTLTVSAEDPETHRRTLTVIDPFTGSGSGTPIHGTLNNVRGSARMSDGSEVYSGSFSGKQFNPQLNNTGLLSVPSDLDVIGNVITFGSLSDSSATAGATLQYEDTSFSGSITASLYSLLARSQARWQWSHASSDGSWKNPVPVMQLDAGHTLNLYPASTSATPSPGVVLNPAGASSFRGPVRVLPAGDLPMDFTSGPQP